MQDVAWQPRDQGDAVEPVSSTTLAVTLVKLGAGSASGPMKSMLRRKSLRRRVARKSSKLARARGIQISAGALRQWLGRDDVQDQLANGSAAAVETAVARLAWLLSGSDDVRRQHAAEVLSLVLSEYLRAQPPSDAVAQSASWAATQVASEHEATRHEVREIGQSVLEGLSDSVAFPEDLRQLHPWRSAEAARLADSWPQLKQMVHTIAVNRDREALFRQWATTPPSQLDGAPPEVWCWLGLLAADYADGATGNQFIEDAIERGLPDANYWWARIALQLPTQEDDHQRSTRAVLERSKPPHALALVQLAVLEGRYQDGIDILGGWAPEEPNARAIKALAISACATGLEDFNLAIAVLQESLTADPEASGPMLRAADLLLVRGRHLESDHRITDFAQALALAIRVRDMRRRWQGDSVPAVLTAVKAAALVGDIDRAWSLTQPAPDGEATASESSDRRLRKEVAILAATMMKTELAKAVSADLDDEFVSAVVDGYLAIDRGDTAAACEHLMAAWDLAPDDSARSQVANSLAPLGGPMPDLTEFETRQPQVVAAVRTVHQVLAAPGDPMASLRAHQHDSEHLAFLLSERLAESGAVEEAADVLAEAGHRAEHPLLLTRAAGRYLAAGNYEAAARTCRTAITLGSTDWPGELDCQKLLFDSLEAQGLHEESLPVARRLVALAPDSRDTRWVLVLCLLRKGETSSAWQALNYKGSPISPRNRADVRAWITLTSKFDRSPHFVGRALDEMDRWRDDPETAGALLAGIYSGMMQLGIEPEADALEAVHQATYEYTARFPDSSTFRTVPVGPDDDPLQAFQEELKRQHEQPGLRALREKVTAGQIPLGVLSEALQLPYAEASIKRAAGFVYSFDPNAAELAATSVTKSLGGSVVLDTTAAVTLALLGDPIADQLKGAFGSLQTTDLAFRDALATQESLAPRSTMSVGWDSDSDRPWVHEVSEEVADHLARQADAVQCQLTATRRRSWQVEHFHKLEMRGAWINTLDLAVSTRTPYWSDDLLLRSLARQEGLPTFGTVDLIRALNRAGRITQQERQVAEANLIANFHIHLGFDVETMQLAAQLDGWRAAGAAATLSKPQTWSDPEPVLEYLLSAMERNHSAAPDQVRLWTAQGAVGLLRLADGERPGAAGNLRLLLERAMVQRWMRPDILPHVILGIRDVRRLDASVDDPLVPFLTALHEGMKSEYGARLAAYLLLAWVQHLEPDDQQLAARIILTTD